MSEYRVISTFFIEGTQSPIYETSRGILYPYIGNDRIVRWKSESEIRLLIVERNILQGEISKWEGLFIAAKKTCSTEYIYGAGPNPIGVVERISRERTVLRDTKEDKFENGDKMEF